MDSGNSGSLQSSSDGGGGGGGGDEVYDSRTESISSFLNPSTHFNPNPILQPPPSSSASASSSSSSHHHLLHHQPPPTFFDLSSVSSFSQSPNPNTNPMYNLDSLWSRNVRPDSSYTDFGSTQTQTLLNSQKAQYPNQSPVDPNINPSLVNEQVGVTTKNPKKRTRASRRAPTTVLTTDTANFRQMVQEFTGIPTAPFSASPSSSPYSRRIDLYGGGITPLHPLRPSAQKIQLQQQPSYLNSNTATTSNIQLPPSDIHGFPKQSLSLSNLQNPLFPFHSLSQTTLPQQLIATESDHQQPEPPNAFPSSSSTSLKRWRGQDENMMSFEGGNGNTQNAVVSSRSDGDQVQGNMDSWICPSD